MPRGPFSASFEGFITRGLARLIFFFRGGSTKFLLYQRVIVDIAISFEVTGGLWIMLIIITVTIHE